MGEMGLAQVGIFTVKHNPENISDVCTRLHQWA
jgi:hypothetical protein